MKLLFTLLAFFLGCARSGEPPRQPTTEETLQQVEQRVTLYSSLIPSERADADGFIAWEECDSTLYSGLLGAALPGTVNLLAARDSDGAWLRRSLAHPECYAEHLAGRPGSKSTISRDMFTGILWWIWKEKRLDVAEDLLAYARANNYIMGKGDPARIALMPNLTKVLAEIVYTLGGESSAERYLPTVFPAGLDGYEAHLQIWQILLDGELHGGLQDRQLDRIKEHFQRRPDNPLFAAAYGKWVSGDMTQALQSMLHPRWPPDRLPSWGDYCTSWWLGQDNPLSMNPCPEGGIGARPNGAELLTVYHLVIQSGAASAKTLASSVK